MLIGQTIAASSTAGETYYTPWFPRQGNDATNVFEVIALASGAYVKVEMETKDSEDTDGTASGIGNTTKTTEGTWSFTSSNAKELCRYKILFGSSGSVTEFCHFRILAPSWQTTGAQSI